MVEFILNQGSNVPFVIVVVDQMCTHYSCNSKTDISTLIIQSTESDKFL